MLGAGSSEGFSDFGLVLVPLNGGLKHVAGMNRAKEQAVDWPRKLHMSTNAHRPTLAS